MNENDERKWIIGIIEKGQQTDYWKLIKKAIQEWIADENKRLDYYKSIGIVKEEMDKYNRTVDRLKYLKKLLTINETIIDYHKSWIDRIRENAEKTYDYLGDSFLKNFKRK